MLKSSIIIFNSFHPLRCVTINFNKNVLVASNLRLNLISSSMSTSNKPNTTVDEDDVQRHSQHINEWWDPKGRLRLLHTYNMLRIPLIRDGLIFESDSERTLTPLKKKKILDVGCGGGILSEGLARIGAEVTGVDASKELIECATEHCKIDPKLAHNKPTYYCTTIEEHAEKCHEHYDAVVASEIIEHVSDKELFLKSCIHALKPGGRIFITTPNRSRLTQLLGIYVSEYILGIVPKGTHEYEKFTTPNEVTFSLERNSCQVELIHGVAYNPLTDKWSWANYTTLMFALQAVKLQ